MLFWAGLANLIAIGSIDGLTLLIHGFDSAFEWIAGWSFLNSLWLRAFMFVKTLVRILLTSPYTGGPSLTYLTGSVVQLLLTQSQQKPLTEVVHDVNSKREKHRHSNKTEQETMRQYKGNMIKTINHQPHTSPTTSATYSPPDASSDASLFGRRTFRAVAFAYAV